MKSVRAKKHLGQHFLHDEGIAEKIGNTLTLEGYQNVLEIGPGMGILTKYLLQKDIKLSVMDVDAESIAYLQEHYPLDDFSIIEGDFLKYDLSQLFGESLPSHIFA